MSPFASPSSQRSPLLSSINDKDMHAHNTGRSHIEARRSTIDNGCMPFMPARLSGTRQNSSDHRYRHDASNIDNAVRRVMKIYDADNHSRVKIIHQNGDQFDIDQYVSVAVQKAKRQANVYRAEVKQVDTVITELEKMIEKVCDEKKALEERKKLLTQKKQEYKDVMFIREAK